MPFFRLRPWQLKNQRAEREFFHAGSQPELAFHRRLSSERFFIAFDGSDGEIVARAAEADEAIPLRKIALHDWIGESGYY